MKVITLMRFTREKTTNERIDLRLLNAEFLSYLTLLRMGFVLLDIASQECELLPHNFTLTPNYIGAVSFL